MKASLFLSILFFFCHNSHANSGLHIKKYQLDGFKSGEDICNDFKRSINSLNKKFINGFKFEYFNCNVIEKGFILADTIEFEIEASKNQCNNNNYVYLNIDESDLAEYPESEVLMNTVLLKFGIRIGNLDNTITIDHSVTRSDKNGGKVLLLPSCYKD
jgi:hypothetical protein